MANKRRGGLTTVMDIAMAGVLALVPVAVVGSWWVGALVFGIGVMWVLRPREESVEPGWKKVVRENNKDDCDPRIPFFDPDRPFGGYLTYRPWIDDD